VVAIKEVAGGIGAFLHILFLMALRYSGLFVFTGVLEGSGVFQKLLGAKGVPGLINARATLPSIASCCPKTTQLLPLAPAQDWLGLEPPASVPPVALNVTLGLAAREMSNIKVPRAATNKMVKPALAYWNVFDLFK